MPPDLGHVDLNLLAALDALLSERSVTRAAQRRMVGQPAMSTSLGRLRRLFDDPLLVRAGRGMRLTPLAESLEEPVRQLMVDTNAILSVRRQFDPATDERAFTIVASDYVVLTLLRPLLRRLTTETPRVRVHVRPVGGDYADLLRTGQVDLVIVPWEVLPNHVVFPHERLFSDQFVCVVGAEHPTIGDRMTLAQFQEEPYLAYHAGPLQPIAEQQLDAAGISRNIEVTTQTFVLAPFLLEGTRLMTLLHLRLFDTVQAPARLRTVEVDLPLRPITEVMLWPREPRGDPGRSWLREQVRRLAGSFPHQSS
ncbi:MAG TPA: LysR family transcriptional regulator [Amycolatopsis sp.]|nr:LysR family transcriptional regulator [Amycolatopsis sp.]